MQSNIAAIAVTNFRQDNQISEGERYSYTPILHRWHQERENEIVSMKDHVYKLIELTGTSTTSIEEAVENAIKRAHKTIKNLSWFQVIETRGSIDTGKVQHWQVTIKIGFTVDDGTPPDGNEQD